LVALIEALLDVLEDRTVEELPEAKMLVEMEEDVDEADVVGVSGPLQSVAIEVTVTVTVSGQWLNAGAQNASMAAATSANLDFILKTRRMI
jgi:hypothetical protein